MGAVWRRDGRCARPNNLPVQLTSFIGREKEIEATKKLFATTRLLTLTGAGGAGKTRLSLQVAADLIDDFDHGVWFVELAPVNDPALVPQTVAMALGLHTGQGFVDEGGNSHSARERFLQS